jgi:hypothetical protein
MEEKYVWMTASIIQIPLKQMNTKHMANTLKCLNGDGLQTIPDEFINHYTRFNRLQWIEIFKNELKLRNKKN